MHSKASLSLRVMNISLALAATWLLLVTSMLMFSRERHEETSRWVYGTDSPLMNSVFLDVLISPAFGIIMVLLAILSLAKEKFLALSIRKKAILNACILSASALLFALLSNSLITPSIAVSS